MTKINSKDTSPKKSIKKGKLSLAKESLKGIESEHFEHIPLARQLSELDPDLDKE